MGDILEGRTIYGGREGFGVRTGNIEWKYFAEVEAEGEMGDWREGQDEGRGYGGRE